MIALTTVVTYDRTLEYVNVKTNIDFKPNELILATLNLKCILNHIEFKVY